MRAGKLDRNVTLLARTVARSATGEAVESWTPAATVAAQAIYERGGERQREGGVQEVADQAVTFRIRWRAGVTATMRVLFNGASYNVRAVLELGRRAGLDLQCLASVE